MMTIPTENTTLEIEDCQQTPVLESGQALIEGKVCTLVQAENPAENYYADVDTGEFVAYAVKPEFQVKTAEDFNWVMGLMLRKESEIAAVETSAEVRAAKAVLANSEQMRKKLYPALNWLELRFKNELAEFAKTQFKGKERTYTGLMGSVSLRAKKGGVKVADAEKALLWAKAFFPDAVKVETKESFLISVVPDGVKQEIEMAFDPDAQCEEMADSMAAAREAFVIELPSDTITIKTGVSPS